MVKTDRRYEEATLSHSLRRGLFKPSGKGIRRWYDWSIEDLRWPDDDEYEREQEHGGGIEDVEGRLVIAQRRFRGGISQFTLLGH